MQWIIHPSFSSPPEWCSSISWPEAFSSLYCYNQSSVRCLTAVMEEHESHTHVCIEAWLGTHCGMCPYANRDLVMEQKGESKRARQKWREQEKKKDRIVLHFLRRQRQRDSSYPTENKGSGLWLTVKGERSGAEVPLLLKAKAHKASHFCGLHFNLDLYAVLYLRSYPLCLNHRKKCKGKKSFKKFQLCWKTAVFGCV